MHDSPSRKAYIYHFSQALRRLSSGKLGDTHSCCGMSYQVIRVS